jgi:hypothetical protein
LAADHDVTLAAFTCGGSVIGEQLRNALDRLFPRR